MRKRNSRMNRRVKAWVNSQDNVQVDTIDRKNIIGKKAFKKKMHKVKRVSADATNTVIMSIGEREVMIKKSKHAEEACTHCCFAKYGRNTRNCPQVTLNERRFNMCTIFGTGNVEYFVEVNADLFVYA